MIVDHVVGVENVALAAVLVRRPEPVVVAGDVGAVQAADVPEVPADRLVEVVRELGPADLRRGAVEGEVPGRVNDREAVLADFAGD